MTPAIYVIPKKSYHMQIPIRVQVKYALDYCNKHNLEYSLPKTESIFSDDKHILPGILETYSTIITFSIGLFGPREYFALTEQKYSNSSHNIALHFTYENKVMGLDEVLNDLEMIERYKIVEEYCNPHGYS